MVFIFTCLGYETQNEKEESRTGYHQLYVNQVEERNPHITSPWLSRIGLDVGHTSCTQPRPSCRKIINTCTRRICTYLSWILLDTKLHASPRSVKSPLRYIVILHDLHRLSITTGKYLGKDPQFTAFFPPCPHHFLFCTQPPAGRRKRGQADQADLSLYSSTYILAMAFRRSSDLILRVSRLRY